MLKLGRPEERATGEGNARGRAIRRLSQGRGGGAGGAQRRRGGVIQRRGADRNVEGDGREKAERVEACHWYSGRQGGQQRGNRGGREDQATAKLHQAVGNQRDKATWAAARFSAGLQTEAGPAPSAADPQCRRELERARPVTRHRFQSIELLSLDRFFELIGNSLMLKSKAVMRGGRVIR